MLLRHPAGFIVARLLCWASFFFSLILSSFQLAQKTKGFTVTFHTWVHAHTETHEYIHTHSHTCMHRQTNMCMHTCTHTCTYTDTYIHIHSCMCTHTHLYTQSCFVLFHCFPFQFFSPRSPFLVIFLALNSSCSAFMTSIFCYRLLFPSLLLDHFYWACGICLSESRLFSSRQWCPVSSIFFSVSIRVLFFFTVEWNSSMYIYTVSLSIHLWISRLILYLGYCK